jgi:predicted ATPase
MYYYYYHEEKIKIPPGFYLKKLILKDHKVFGDKIEIDFMEIKDSENKDFTKNFYTSLLIGANGTGKSILFSEIISIFLGLANRLDKEQNRNKTLTKFYLCYFLNEKKIEFFNYEYLEESNSKRRSQYLNCRINDIDADYSLDHLPKNILASSLLLNDRYTITKNNQNFYKYLGIRNINSPRTAGTRTNIKRNVEQIVNKIETGDDSIKSKIISLLDFLEYNHEFRIKYKPKYRSFFFNGYLTAENFIELFENFNDANKGFSKRKDSDFIPFGVSFYRNNLKGNKDKIVKVIDFLNSLQDSDIYAKAYDERSRSIDINLLKADIPEYTFSNIKLLQELDLISFPTVLLSKKEQSIEISEISSGEYNILSGLIGVYTNIEDNSLIFIDEPEISLHPNWQMRYMGFLNKLFKEYPTCHFIIATHSHFFASDLDGKYSKIIGLKRDSVNNIETMDLPMNLDTYGWSAEEILYRVFNVRSVRNYFLEQDLTMLFGLIGQNSKDKKQITELVERIDKLPITDKDPLKEIIIEAKNYLTQ